MSRLSKDRGGASAEAIAKTVSKTVDVTASAVPIATFMSFSLPRKTKQA